MLFYRCSDLQLFWDKTIQIKEKIGFVRQNDPLNSSSLAGVWPQHSMKGSPEPQIHRSMGFTRRFERKSTEITGSFPPGILASTRGKTIFSFLNMAYFSDTENPSREQVLSSRRQWSRIRSMIMSRSAAVENRRLTLPRRYREICAAAKAFQSSSRFVACLSMPYPFAM